MVEFRDLIPEFFSFAMGLILTVFGVPSVADIGILIISGIQNAMNAVPNMPAEANFVSSLSIVTLRFVGAFLEIEFPLRLLIWHNRRKRNGDYL